MYSKFFKCSQKFANSKHFYNTQTKPVKHWKRFILGGIVASIAIGFTAKIVIQSKTSKVNVIEQGSKPKLIVLGTGWASLSCISELDTSNFDVTIVSPTNYFLFTPLLPSVATGALETTSIIEPIRKYCQRTNSENINFFEASCTNIDPKSNTIECRTNKGGVTKEFKLDYDYLIIAVGAINNTFGIKGVEENCQFLKSIDDATGIKKKIIDQFELASLSCTPLEEKKKLLSFVVCGGGPAGTETAAEIQDFINNDLKRWYPNVSSYAKVTIVELLENILNTYNKSISEYVEKQFKSREINLKTNSKIVGVEKDSIIIMNKQNQKEELPYGLAIWTTGIGTSPLITNLREKIPEQTNRRALLTDRHLKVKGVENIFALGDCATIEQELMLTKLEEIFNQADSDHDGKLSIDEFTKLVNTQVRKYPQLKTYSSSIKDLFERGDKNKDGLLSKEEFHDLVKEVDSKITLLPPTAQVASQEGKYLGNYLNKMIKGEKELEPFRYKHFVSMSSIGDNKAVIDSGKYAISGLGAWYLWKSIYLSKQYSFSNKLAIAGDWINSSIFGRKITREN